MELIDCWGIPTTLHEDMGVLLEGVNPNDAILMWPVSLMGQTVSDGVDMHITLNWGKWDGPEEELRASAEKLLEGVSTALPSFHEWVPAEFKGREKSFKVLQVPSLKNFVFRLRQLVSPLFEDRFGEGYMPHITVSDAIWTMVSEQKITPREAHTSIGKLELRLGDKVVHQLQEASRSIPASQKMVLKDMLEKGREWREWPGGFYAPADEQRARAQERLFSVYVLWGVMRSLVRKGLVSQKAKNGIQFFSITSDGMAVV